jgi:hypothetical protein
MGIHRFEPVIENLTKETIVKIKTTLMILGSLAALPLFGGRSSSSYTIEAEGLLPQTSFAAGSYVLNGTMANLSGSSAGSYTLLTGVNPASNTLIALPSIVEQPVAVDLNEGEDLTLSVTPGGPGPYMYQWYKGGEAITDATLNPFELMGVSGDDEGDYYVVVSNPFGEVSSLTASVSVLVKPEITVGLTDKVAKKGASVAFTFSYVSEVAPTFTWYLDGVVIEGATSSFLSVSNIGDEDFGTYTVDVTNPGGTASSSAELIQDGLKSGDGPPALEGSELISETDTTATYMSDWFGEFTVNKSDPLGWVYTKPLGWTYFTFISTPEVSYIYPLLVGGILYTNQSLYPTYAYSYNDSSWLLLNPTNDAETGTIWAWVYATNSWMGYTNDQ